VVMWLDILVGVCWCVYVALFESILPNSAKYIISFCTAVVISCPGYQKPSYATVCVCTCIWYRFDTAVFGVTAMKIEALYS
jgi:hypothetical protein